MSGESKFGLDSVVKKRTVQKFDIRSDSFLMETACNPPFKYKVTLLALNVQIKNILKHVRNRV